MGSSNREKDDGFQWSVDSDGNRWVEPTQSNGSITDHISSIDNDTSPLASLIRGAYGPGISRRLLRGVIAGYGHADNIWGRFSIEERLISSYRHAIRQIGNHMTYDSPPADVELFRALLTSQVVKRAKSMYLPRVVVVPPVSARQMMQGYKNKRKDIVVLAGGQKGDFISNAEKRDAHLKTGRSLIHHFPWEEYESVWNDGKKEQEFQWEVWITDGSMVRVIIDDPMALSKAVQRIRKKQLQPFGGLRRALSLYIVLPNDLTFLELTGSRYFKVCINPNSAVQAHTGSQFGGLLMGFDGIQVYIDDSRWLSLVAAMRIF